MGNVSSPFFYSEDDEGEEEESIHHDPNEGTKFAAGGELRLSTATEAQHHDVTAVAVVESVESIGRSHRGADNILDEETIRFHDHFSLNAPSSTLRFRGSNVKIYEDRGKQFVIETSGGPPRLKRNNGNDALVGTTEDGIGRPLDVTVRHVESSNWGIRVLRAIYTFVAVLVTGFLYIFCFQLIVYLFMDLAYFAGYTSTNPSSQGLAFFSTLLAVPVFVYGFSVIMTVAAAFVVDTWNGFSFLRTIGNILPIVTEWMCFGVFLVVPAATATIALFLGLTNWWEKTALAWFSSVFVFYLVFAFSVVFYEIQACLRLEGVDANLGGKRGRRRLRWKEVAPLVKNAIHRKQVSQYSGTSSDVFLLTGAMPQHAGSSCNPTDNGCIVHHRKRRGVYSRMTLLSCCNGRFFTKLEVPKRIYSIDEVLHRSLFIAAETWTLDKPLFCGQGNMRTAVVVKGPSALRGRQVASSFTCAVLGITMAVLYCIALASWFVSTGWVLFVVSVLVILFFLPCAVSVIRRYKIYRDVVDLGWTSGYDGSSSEAVYQIWETRRLSETAPWLCWSTVAIELFFFFLWPTIFLAVVKNTALAAVFVVIGLITISRHYLSAAVILMERGSLDISRAQNGSSAKPSPRTVMAEDRDRMTWKEIARLSQIITKVSEGRRRLPWMVLFTVFVVVFIMITIGSMSTHLQFAVVDKDPVLVSDFYYKPQPNLPYPTCRLDKGFELPDGRPVALTDYAFASVMAFLNTSAAQADLDQWFGGVNATDEYELVRVFKEENPSTVTYKLISFTSTNGDRVALVSVRGTITSWDIFENFQLWMPTIWAQAIRAILPVGEIWTPILKYFVKMVAVLGAESLDRVSYYKHTTKFVKMLQDSGEYSAVHVTGHSLGGGIAIITGAQTGAPTVAVSGPNARITGMSLDPPVTPDQLDRFVFNIVPDNDIVPRIDDLAHLYQRISCHAPPNEIQACHNDMRALCEILYTCGTGPRPAICQCSQLFGYPEPIQNGTRSFDQACTSNRR